MLSFLLYKLQQQVTNDLFTYSVVVVDNDYNKSAKAVVESFKENSNIIVSYHLEPKQNIALARNKAVENVNSNYVAFIDDDEFPGIDWLLQLYNACNKYDVDGVLGPVKPHFEFDPPKWAIKGKFFERSFHETGYVLHWTNTRTGNVFLKNIFNNKGNKFKLEFGSGGEDQDFFRRMIEDGYKFIWCNEAPVYERIPPERLEKVFLIKRALLRGKQSTIYQSFGGYEVIKSIVAIPVYIFLLPFTMLAGEHVFIKYLIKCFDHIGKILALCRYNVIKEKYVLFKEIK
jgi:succinoglycan biosynthesis protein ExoM